MRNRVFNNVLKSVLKKATFFAPLAVFGFLVCMFIFALNNENKEEIPSPLIGKFVPEFQLPSLLENTILDQTIFQGKPVLLNVWGSWCPSCIVEHDYLSQLAKSGIPIVGLNYKDTVPNATRFLTRLGNPFSVVIFDEKGSLGLDLGVYGAPETYLISAEGRVLTKRIGVLDERVWEKQFQAIWQPEIRTESSEP